MYSNFIKMLLLSGAKVELPSHASLLCIGPLPLTTWAPVGKGDRETVREGQNGELDWREAVFVW